MIIYTYIYYKIHNIKKITKKFIVYYINHNYFKYKEKHTKEAENDE